ncbi:class I SAM-dependent methyltransferase [Pararhizobium gei]|uniref:class I SAM-dependent methyltransferase n=1 Tax=Pararhizobium gei TaxID=1395951 RepID=UPI0023DB7BE2|nr:methyltransferase domain-containing protein [Rhizobium gei]
MKTENLDAVSSEYLPNAATAIENDLILNWYPERIIKRFGTVGSILELGIGHGYTPGLFNAACDRHVIIEGSQLVIDLFKERAPDFKGEVVFSYFEEFETEERFDVIVMGFILEHVDDPGMLLDRYKKFLKPGGRMFVAVPNAKSMNRRLGVELGKIDDIYALNANDHALGHKRQYCRDTLKQEIQNHGYIVSLEEGIYLKPLPLGVLKTLPDFKENLDAMLRVGVDFPDLCVALLMEARLQ